MDKKQIKKVFVEEKTCSTCSITKPTRKIWNDRLLGYEAICVECDKEKYPDLYDASECDKCGSTKWITGGHGDYGNNFYCKMCVEQIKWLQAM